VDLLSFQSQIIAAYPPELELSSIQSLPSEAFVFFFHMLSSLFLFSIVEGGAASFFQRFGEPDYGFPEPFFFPAQAHFS